MCPLFPATGIYSACYPKVKIRIPKTKMGGTEVEDYYWDNVIEKYQVTPVEFIDLKALMGMPLTIYQVFRELEKNCCKNCCRASFHRGGLRARGRN